MAPLAIFNDFQITFWLVPTRVVAVITQDLS